MCGQRSRIRSTGMLSAENLAALDALDSGYVVGARQRNLPMDLQEKILHLEAYGPLDGPEGRPVAEWDHKGRRLIVAWCPERARKDTHDHRETVERLMRKLERSSNPRERISNRGAKRFVAVEGDARLVADEEKIAEAARWDGLLGVITSLRDMPAAEVLTRYHGLWQEEENFRITRHDLRVRQIWCWTADRIRAHIATSFMAFACVGYLAYSVATQQRRMSPEVMRSALTHRQCAILRCKRTDNRYVVPSNPTLDAKRIYATMSLPLPTTPYELT